MLKNKRRGLGLRIADYVEELNDVCASAYILKNFNLSLDLLLFDGLEDLDDTLGGINDIDAFENLRVFAAANLPNDFVLFLIAPVDCQCLVVPIFTGTMNIDIGIDPAD
jgi:hypothetical protein